MPLPSPFGPTKIPSIIGRLLRNITQPDVVEEVEFEAPDIFTGGISSSINKSDEDWDVWGAMPWWTYDTAPPPVQKAEPEPQEGPTQYLPLPIAGVEVPAVQRRLSTALAALSESPDVLNPFPRHMGMEETAWVYTTNHSIQAFGEDVYTPALNQIAGDIKGAAQWAGTSWQKVRQVVGTLVGLFPFMPSAYVEDGMVYPPGGPLPPSHEEKLLEVAPHVTPWVFESWQKVRQGVGTLASMGLPFSPSAYVEGGMVYPPGGPLPPSQRVEPSGTLKEDIATRWDEAKGFRYTHLVDAESLLMYKQLLTYGDTPDIVLHAPIDKAGLLYTQEQAVLYTSLGIQVYDPAHNWVMIPRRNYTPEEAGNITESTLIESVVGLVLDLANLIPARWLGAGFKAVTLPVRIPVKVALKGVGRVVGKIPRGAWLAELTAQSKAGLAGNAAGDVVDYIKYADTSLSLPEVLGRDPAIVAKLPNHIVQSLDYMLRFADEADIARAVTVLDETKDLSAAGNVLLRATRSGALDLARAHNQEVWGGAYAAAKIIGSLKVFEWLRRVESMWAAHVLGSRPAWTIFNYTDNVMKTALEGVSPFRRLGAEVDAYRAAFGEIPREAFGTFGRTVEGRVTYEAPLVHKTVREHWEDILRHVESQPMPGGKLNPLSWMQGLNFKLSADAEQGARLRIYLNRFEQELYRNSKNVFNNLPRDINPEVRQAIIDGLSTLKNPNKKDVAAFFDGMLKPSWQARVTEEGVLQTTGKGTIRLYNLGVQADDIPNITKPMSDRITSQLRRLADRGRPLARNEITSIFDGVIDDLVKVESEEIQSELVKHLGAIELPETGRDMLRAVLTPERMRTAEGWVAAYNDLIALPEKLLASHHLTTAHVGPEARTLWKAGQKQKAQALWKSVYKSETDKYRTFIAEWKKAYLAFNGTLRKQAGNDIPKYLVDDLFKQTDIRHQAILRMYRNNALSASRASHAARPDIIWEQRLLKNTDLARDVTKAKMATVEIHVQVNTLLGNLNLPHAAALTKVPVSGAWDLALDVVERVAQDTRKKYATYYDELEHMRRVVTTNRLRPWRNIAVTADDIKRLGEIADSTILDVDMAVTKAKEYGLHEVNRVLFDYLRTNNLQNVIRHVFPFWRWPSHNIPYYAEALFRHPSMVSKLAYFYRVVPQQNALLPSRAKYSVPIPFSERFMEALLGVPSRLYFNPTTFISILQQLPTSAYKQRLMEQWYTDKEQPALGKAFELMSMYGGAPYPWVEWLLGMEGMLGDDWYPRNALPWSIMVEDTSNRLGVFTTQDEYGNTVGFNPDTEFRKNILSMMGETFGWTEEDYTTDRYRIWLMGRNMRRDILQEKGYEVGETPSEVLARHDPQAAANEALREVAVTTLIGHMTGIYGQVITPEDIEERLLRAERKSIDAEYPTLAGEAYRDAVIGFMDEHPEFATIGNTYSEYPWAKTTDELEAGRREAEVSRAKSDYWQQHDEIVEEREKELNAAIKVQPYNRAEHRRVKDAYRQQQDELRQKYMAQFPELDLGWSLWGKTVEEIEKHFRDNLMSAYVDLVYPDRVDYVLPDGTFDDEAYYAALDFFYTDPWAVVSKAPELDTEIMRLMGVYGVSRNEAEAILARYFTGEGVEEYFRQNDTIMEAAVEAYQTFFYGEANREYWEEIKPQLEDIDASKTLSITEKSTNKRALMDDFFARWGPVSAEKLVPYVLTLYPDRGWTELEFISQYANVIFPGVEQVWEENKSGKDRIVAALWDEWEGLSSLDKKIVAEALGEQFVTQFLAKETRDVEGVDVARLGLWLTAIQQAQEKAPDNWRKWLTVPEPGGAAVVLQETDLREASGLLVPEVYGGLPGVPWALVLSGISDTQLDTLFSGWNALQPWQQDMVEVLHPGAKEGMAALMSNYATNMTDNQRLYLRARINAWVETAPSGNDPLADALELPYFETADDAYKFILQNYPYQPEAIKWFDNNLSFFRIKDLHSTEGGGLYYLVENGVYLMSVQPEAVVHELAHAWWEGHNTGITDEFMEAVQQLAEERDPQYERAQSLADSYINGIPANNWEGLWVTRNHREMYAGLASGIMGDIRLLPPYVRKYYADLFKPLPAGEKTTYTYEDVFVPTRKEPETLASLQKAELPSVPAIVSAQAQLVIKTGVPEIELSTPEDSASYERAKQLNEAYWDARERDDALTYNKIADDADWLKWFGSTPKALFWRYYYANVPPGWRTEELRDDDVVSAILSKGVRGYLPEAAYEEAIGFMKQWVDTHPEAIIGDVKEWEQVKQEIQEYLQFPSGSEERKEYWRSHPLLEKYYARPSKTATSGGGGGGGGGTGGGPYAEWQTFADAAKDLLPVLMGEIIAYLGMAHQAFSSNVKAYLLALWGKYGSGKSFDEWLKAILELWRRYGGVTPTRAKQPSIPQARRSSGGQGGVRLRMRR